MCHSHPTQFTKQSIKFNLLFYLRKNNKKRKIEGNLQILVLVLKRE